MERGLYPGVCHVMSFVWCARFSVSSFPREAVSVSCEISIPREYDFDSGFCFSEMGLFWIETVVLRILS